MKNQQYTSPLITSNIIWYRQQSLMILVNQCVCVCVDGWQRWSVGTVIIDGSIGFWWPLWRMINGTSHIHSWEQNNLSRVNLAWDKLFWYNFGSVQGTYIHRHFGILQSPKDHDCLFMNPRSVATVTFGTGIQTFKELFDLKQKVQWN